MAMEGDSDCIHGINLDYSHCLECEGLINNQAFNGNCPTCGQCYQGPINKFWQRLCMLFGVTGLILGGIFGWLLTKLGECFHVL